MSYLTERVKHAFRYRHKRGFGVHSPFMYNLILNVLRDREKQFSYPMDMEGKFNSREKKIYRLLSRLIRFLHVRHVSCLGNSASVLTGYLSQAYKEAEIYADRAGEVADSDFIYAGRGMDEALSEQLMLLMKVAPDRKICIVVADIHKKGFNGRFWRGLKEKATVSVDMMWYGILFFDEKIQKGKYKLII